MFDITEDRDNHYIKQLSIFLPNRLGQLLMVHRIFDAHDIKLCAVSIVEAADHAVARVVVDKPTLAQQMLITEGYSVVDADLIAVVLPNEVGIGRVLKAMLLRELNVHYVYSLITQNRGRTIVALHAEDPDVAEEILTEQGFRLIGQDDL